MSVLDLLQDPSSLYRLLRRNMRDRGAMQEPRTTVSNRFMSVSLSSKNANFRFHFSDNNPAHHVFPWWKRGIASFDFSGTVRCGEISARTSTDRTNPRTATVALVRKGSCASPTFSSRIAQALKLLEKPMIMGLLLGVLLIGDPKFSMAASGGRMGGDSFSSSAPPSSLSHSTVLAEQKISYPSPYYDHSLFSHRSSSSACVVGVNAESSLSMVMMGTAAVVFLCGFLTDRANRRLPGTEKISVLKLQVGLLGTARSFQRDLDEIAKHTDTSTCKALHSILTETTLAVLRHQDLWISAYTSGEVTDNASGGEESFRRMCFIERSKLDRETLVNVNAIRRRSTGDSHREVDVFCNGYIVVTIIVAVQGTHHFPSIIGGSSDLRDALWDLGSLTLRAIRAVEVMWTPQDPCDTLVERQYLRDYPLLRTL